MSGDPVYRRSDVLWRRTSDRVLLLVPGNEEFVTLTATGCALWAALEEPGSVGQVAERLAALYGASVSQIEADITPVIEELMRRDVLTVRCRER